MFEEIISTASILATFIVGFMQVLKPLIEDTKFIPIMSVFLGILLSLLFVGISWFAVRVGAVSGLMAVGAYNVTTKSLLKK